MGRTSAGVGIKTDKPIELKEIVTELYGTDYEKSDKYVDIRSGGIVISKSQNYIHIQDSKLAESFFSDQAEKTIFKLNRIFGILELIVAYEQYDSGGTYSYAILRNGKINRQFRSLSYETVLDQGELEEIEREWATAEVREFDLGDGEIEITLHKQNQQCDKQALPEVILNHILFHYLKIEDPAEPILEYSFFTSKNI